MKAISPLESPLDHAIRLAGSQVALAKLLGCSQPTVSLWKTRGMPVPAEHCVRIEKALGIPRSSFRPDLFEPEDYSPLAQRSAAPPSAVAPLSPTAAADGSSPAPASPAPAPAPQGEAA